MSQFMQGYFALQQQGAALLESQYDPLLVALSFLVIVFAAHTTLALVSNMRTAYAAEERSAPYWWAGAALTLGGGIFVMHFVAMLAFSIPVEVRYDLGMTLLSLLTAVSGAAAALAQVRGELTLNRLLWGGLWMGGSVAAMHYIGMASLLAPALLRYLPGLWGLSIVVAIVVSWVAILLFYWASNRERRLSYFSCLMIALVVGAAAAGMHYTGMAAASFYSGGACGVSTQLFGVALERGELGVQVSLIALLVIAMGRATSLFNARLTSLLQRENSVLEQKVVQRTAELLHAKEKLELILDSMEEGVVVVDRDGKILQVNAQLEQMQGKTASELRSSAVQTLFEEGEMSRRLGQMLRKEQRGRLELQLLQEEGGEMPIEMTVAWLNSEESGAAPNQAVLVLHDASEQIRQRYQDRYDVFQTSITEMSATVMHNIGNVLAGMYGTVNGYKQGGKDLQLVVAGIRSMREQLEEGRLEPERMLQGLSLLADTIEQIDSGNPDLKRANGLRIHTERLESGIRHAKEIIHVFREGSSADSETARFSLRQMVEDSTVLIEERFQRNQIELQVDVPSDIRVKIPRNLSMQMVINLLKNSFEAVQQRKEQAPALKGSVVVSAAMQGESQIRLEVADNGCGISVQQQQEIFNYGFTTKQSGSGIGLHSIINFVKSIGGRVTVKSDGEGRGATIQVILPVDESGEFCELSL